MKLEFDSEEERNEFLILRDLWLADDVVLDHRRVQIGRVENRNTILLSQELPDLDRNIHQRSGPPEVPQVVLDDNLVGARDRLRALAR